jgi:HK97 family phage prohead protease
MRDTAPFVLDAGLPTAKALPADDDIIIEGYAADFEVDRQGEAFEPGAFDAACAKATKDEIPLLQEHDNKRQLGVVEELRVDDQGLWTRARIAAGKAGTWSEDAVDKIKRGMMRGLSVRGLSRVKMTANGPRIAGIDLAEISVTPVPVQPGALFAVAEKSLAYAADPDDATDIAWAAGEWAKVQANYSDDEIREAIRAYFQRRIDECRRDWERIQPVLSDRLGLE